VRVRASQPALEHQVPKCRQRHTRCLCSQSPKRSTTATAPGCGHAATSALESAASRRSSCAARGSAPTQAPAQRRICQPKQPRAPRLAACLPGFSSPSKARHKRCSSAQASNCFMAAWRELNKPYQPGSVPRLSWGAAFNSSSKPSGPACTRKLSKARSLRKRTLNSGLISLMRRASSKRAPTSPAVARNSMRRVRAIMRTSSGARRCACTRVRTSTLLPMYSGRLSGPASSPQNR
jgi:hypothetical protein